MLIGNSYALVIVIQSFLQKEQQSGNNYFFATVGLFSGTRSILFDELGRHS